MIRAAIPFVLAAAVLAGCAGRAELMTPQFRQDFVSADNARLHRAVALGEVGGGETTKGGVEIGNAALREALDHALAAHGYLSSDPARAPYRLNAFLVELRDPAGGFTVTADSFVRYTLTQTADGKVLFDEIVRGSDTKTLSDEFTGAERIRLADEAALRMSIVHLLRRLALY